MGKRTTEISPEQSAWILEQPMFFVATAMEEGTINLSPKGMDAFRVLAPDRVCWLNLTGSGNETATHLQSNPRMTIMFNAFWGKPKILRLYGKAKCYHVKENEFTILKKAFPDIPGMRQIIEMEVEMVQVSCGFGVPQMQFEGQRGILEDWAEKKGDEGIQEYWKEKNQVSLDGHKTNIIS